AGALLGMRASDRAARAREVCPTDPCNDPGALALSEQSGRDATRANVAFVTGSLLVAGGVVLWFVGAPRAPDDDRAARLVPVVQPGEASLVVRGRF
ncbi:MAG: hypothetical protein K8M05_30635, partial [Deltaproteobacteria bacterium]|nr:hypothetical protein [Kofleriaceae bacterium]